MRLAFWRKKPEQRATSIDAMLSAWFAPNAASGVTVNVDTALRVTTVLACARVLAEGVAQVPLKLYRETAPRKKDIARDHPLYQVLYLRPNDWQTSFEFRETLMYHAVLTGNAYAFVNRLRGAVVELIPIVPGRVVVTQNQDYSLRYEVLQTDGNKTVIPQANMMHLRGPSWNSYAGLDAVRMAREAIGLALATEESHARLHGNGARPGGILSVEGNLDQHARERLKAAWMEFQGGQNAFKTAVLDQKATWTPMAMRGVDAQHLETRRFQIEEISRAMRVFPQMVMSTDKTSTYASAEQFFIAHVVHSLGPWFRRWEETIQRDLLTKDEIAGGYEPQFNVNALLRGDAQARANFYNKGILDGWMTRNDARAEEGWNALDGLDEPLQPANMTSTAGKGTGGIIGDPQATKAAASDS